MKVYNLSSDRHTPCYAIRFNEVLLMLDCSLSLDSLLNFVPLHLFSTSKYNNWMPSNNQEETKELIGELKVNSGQIFVDSAPEFGTPIKDLIDFAELDIILISNYSSMLALPFITEGTGFKGIVYATDPVLRFGRMYMEELVEYIERTPNAKHATKWKELFECIPSLQHCLKCKKWKSLYSKKDLKNCLSKVKCVKFNEKLDVFGKLQLTAASSGYCIGSCNWIIATDFEKISYLSMSSVLFTHPKPLDQNILKNCDLMLIPSFNRAPIADPNTMLRDICKSVAIALKDQGTVIFPLYSSGVVYDLLSCLTSFLSSSNANPVPLFFLAPAANESLSYSLMLSEWLSDSKQQLVYNLQDPFIHGELLKSGQLKVYSELTDNKFHNDFTEPCIIFCGHPSFRFGDIVHLIKLFGSDSRNLLVLTEPEFDPKPLLAPFQPLKMKHIHCPIDTSLNFNQLSVLIQDLNPTNLIVPRDSSHQARNKFDKFNGFGQGLITIAPGEIVTPDLKIKKVKATLDSSLSDTFDCTEIKPNVFVGTLNATLQHNPTELRFLNKGITKHEYGEVDVNDFICKLKSNGFTNITTCATKEGHIVILENEKMNITIEKDSSHICGSVAQETVRRKLRSILMSCLNSF